MAGTGSHRFAMLDGWRATSILLVLAGHLLPLGPRWMELNAAVAASGMALFFILSGFLITRFLAETRALTVFFIRRFARIVPLAWVAIAVALPMAGASPYQWVANLFFFANLPPFGLADTAAHLWSLSLEMQFYVAIALFVGVFGQRALHALPLFCLAVTGARIATGTTISIVTWFRADEILAGGVLALTYAGWFGATAQRLVARTPVWIAVPLLFASAHPAFGPLMYLRPYLAMLTVGSTLYNAPALLRRVFETRAMAYVATTSYALYIIHGVLMSTWLGSGGTLVKYAKRPLLFALTFGLAHLSTFRFEQPLVARAKRLADVPRGHEVA